MRLIAILLSILTATAAVAAVAQAYIGIWTDSGTFGASALMTAFITVGLLAASSIAWDGVKR